MDIPATFKLLDQKLQKLSIEREIYICGGAALILLKVSSRATMDVDVLTPRIDRTLANIAIEISHELGLSEQWLNNGPEDLRTHLDKDWEGRCSIVFKGSALTVHALHRLDLIKTKLWAACDRHEDIPDLLSLNPTDAELLEAKHWVLKCHTSEIWPKLVKACLQDLKQRKVK